MVQRICPICDQVMKHSHYCRNCRSWVRQPFEREVTYYLNERHPENEQDGLPGKPKEAVPVMSLSGGISRMEQVTETRVTKAAIRYFGQQLLS